ncbi:MULTISPECIES: hypothetical protein [Pseudomonas]|uniref:DUF4156 domain-containing protein n=1 Tax=Pseudomonas sessilinigenes TaxID=658629 RepID=A0ABX8MMS2_9PSED|nr:MULTISPECIES: hypothetical protein [Pseudomonas]AZC27068.1 hypothetical protein C4K39_5425 [Pseudomonas sessilinigenes]QIH07577.1 DUF4156 domain-containing protein [Pseudomonas sp. BIOMIG1BAC]QXH38980.1 DUF4156 domain-containing protein [Pseudomonas sessilinigenes]
MGHLRVALLLFVPLTLICGCTTQLTEAGRQVSLVTAASAQACKVLKPFTVKGSSNADALNMAFNKSAELGGDSVAVVDVADDSSIQAAALQCHP